MSEYLDNVPLYLILCFIIIFFGYFLIRSYFVNYELKGNKLEINKRIRILAMMVGITAIITLVDVIYTEGVKVSNGSMENTTVFTFWVQSYFVTGTYVSYTYRVFSIICLITGVSGIVVSGVYKKDILLILSFIIGIISPFFISMDFPLLEQSNVIFGQKYVQLYIKFNMVGIILTIVFVVIMVIVFLNKFWIKKHTVLTE